MKAKILIFGMLSIFALVAFASADYSGYLPYMLNATGAPFDYTYNVSIDEGLRTITFIGNENPADIIIVDYDEAQSFTKRINWVWFNGWFDTQNLFINQYVGTGVIYNGPATQVAPGVYRGEIFLPSIPYFNIPINMAFTIMIDTVNNMAYAWPTIYPSLVFEAPLDQQYGVAAQAFGPFLMQASLVNIDGGSMIEVEEWMKEDLSYHGLAPRWTVQLTSMIPLVYDTLTTIINNDNDETSEGSSSSEQFVKIEESPVESVEVADETAPAVD